MGLYDIVRFEGVNQDWLLYKFPSDEFNTKSKLIVSPAQIAILVHNGQIEKILESGTYTLNTELLPFIKRFTKGIFSGNNPYPMEVYFLNKRLKLDFFWGTSDPIEVLDPQYKIILRMRSRGQLGVKLENYQYFYQTLVGTLLKNRVITFAVLNEYFRGIINQKIKKNIANKMIGEKITFFEIGLHLDELQKSSEEELNEEFAKFGFNVVNFSIESIDCPKEDTDKLNEILHKKAELDQLGDTGYRTARGYDVLEAGAKGNGNASAFMGVGMGMQMGQAANVGAGGIIPPSQAKESHDDMIACPKCGAEISAHSKFCPECGCKIVHECPKCGASVSPRQKFCPECGTKLYEEEK